MAERTVYCEECVEEIPASEVYWDDSRLYCRRCGSEVEPPDRDIFEEIVDNRSGFLFRNGELDDADEEEEEEAVDEERDAAPAVIGDEEPAGPGEEEPGEDEPGEEAEAE